MKRSLSSSFFLFLAVCVFVPGQPVLAAQEPRVPVTLPAPTLQSPADGVELHGYPRIINFEWTAVPGASSYSIEIDCLDCCGRGVWCENAGKPGYIVHDLEVPGLSFAFWGDQAGRWRVWAQSPTGDGNMSEWRRFIFNNRAAGGLSGSSPGFKTIANYDCSWRSSQTWEPATAPAQLTYSPMPEYSGGEDKQKVNAIVSLEVKVGIDGKVEDVCVLNSAKTDLTEAAVGAVKAWRFAPAQKQNVAIASIAHLEIRFRACCDQAVLFYPAPPKAAVAQAAAGSKMGASSPCPFSPGQEPGTTVAKAVYDPEPSYTEAARKNKLSGEVVLFIKIGANGRVEDVCVARSLRADLDESAKRTVKTWRFEPAQRNGVAVASFTSVEIGFHLY